jgi:iron complex transport system permease protein
MWKACLSYGNGQASSLTLGEANLKTVLLQARPLLRRRAVFALACLALVGVAVLVSLAFGSRSIPVGEVLAAVFGDVDSDNATVITSQRLPRTLLGLACGLALGMAGALMQGHTRNPLADPGLFGVNAGATFAVALLVFAADVASRPAIVLAGLLGAAAATALIFVLGLRSAGSGGALVLLAVIGTTVTALLTALTSALVLLDNATLDVMRFWEVGALSNRDYSLMWWIAPLLVAGIVLGALNATSLNRLGLGDDVARTQGTAVRRSRWGGIAAITLLVGPVTAICGPIAFLGLVAPHAARVVAGHDQRWLVPCAGLLGASVLLLADTLGRVAQQNGELQVGIVMALVGAPVLLAVTRRRRLVAL